MELNRIDIFRQQMFNSTLDADVLAKYNLTEYVKNLNELWKNGSEEINAAGNNYYYNNFSLYDMTNSEKVCYCNGTMRNIATLYRGIHGYTSLLVCIFGTLANLFNIIVLTRKPMRNGPFAYILTWLAITDMLLMTEYIPFVFYMHLTSNLKIEKFSYEGAVYILIHNYLSQVLHTVSICLTLTLAFWRYNAIRYPEKCPTLWTRKKCGKMIKIAIIFPIIICAPSYFTFSIHSIKIQEEKEEEYFLSRKRPKLLYYIDLSEISKSNNGLFYITSLWLYAVVIKLLPCIILGIISFSLVNALNYSLQKREMLQKAGNMLSLEGHKRLKRSKRKTDRSSQMLIAILFLFLITEFPQCILGLLSGILGKCFFRYCYHLFGEIMDILALINGAINFILYCTMSKQFRQTFREIFRYIKVVNRHPISSSCKEDETYI